MISEELLTMNRKFSETEETKYSVHIYTTVGALPQISNSQLIMKIHRYSIKLMSGKKQKQIC